METIERIVEVNGCRRGDAQLKAETMRTMWCPGVDNLGVYGRWAFAEFTAVFDMQAAFAELIEGFLQPQEAA